MKRQLSHSEMSKAFTCQAQHAFAYTGHLTDGMALRKRVDGVKLREGRAWGKAVAAFHEIGQEAGLNALHLSLSEDAHWMRKQGVFVTDDYEATILRMEGIYAHYCHTAEPLSIHSPELSLHVPIRSRQGGRASSRFEFFGRVDGIAVEDGYWIVEYKLRDRLTPVEHIEKDEQAKRYAWAAEQIIGRPVSGVIVDERLNAAPKQPRVLKNGRPSHAKDQLTTAYLYRILCETLDEPFDGDTYKALRARKWQQRVRVEYTRGQIEEVGADMVSAARLISQLDSGALKPVRSPDIAKCGRCQYAEICTKPQDEELVDALFERRPPKRDRPEPLPKAAVDERAELEVAAA